MLVYDPVAGLTIKEAMVEAIFLAKKYNDLIEAHINDITIYVTPKSNLTKIINLYKSLNHQEYINLKQKTR